MMKGWILILVLLHGGGSMLYPRESANREVKDLSGLWQFRADYSMNRNEGVENEWHKQPLSKTGDVLLMPVPSSFNDITQNPRLRDFVGWVWYQRQLWLPRSWSHGNTRIMLRLGSAHYNAIAWINDHKVTEHSGGHLPFEGEVTAHARFGTPNTLTVAVNNTLGPHTLPPGSLSFYGPPSYPEGYFVQNLQMDFFNYAGLHRPVRLYTTPTSLYLDDITTTTSLQANGTATLHYTLEVGGNHSGEVLVTVSLIDKDGVTVETSTQSVMMCSGEGCSTRVTGRMVIARPFLWWPWTMSPSPGYLHTLQVRLRGGDTDDEYLQPVGLRTVEVKGAEFLINGEPFYFHGFGKHEDADIRGKGLDYPLLMKDMNLLLWLGANSFRTSHYPYSEEQMILCDQHGIVVIDETPAVGLKLPENFASETLDHHIEVMKELVSRDKNHPSVVMWSLANEPKTRLPAAAYYFKRLAEVTRALDPTRPITFANSVGYSMDLATQFMDVVCLNRYFGWYRDGGHPETIGTAMTFDLEQWYKKHKKPIIITEYGAGSVAGIHEDPPVMYSEDYQLELLTQMFPVFDKFRGKFLVGEMLWTFADFATKQTTTRMAGNKKGVLTRQREPKAAARLIRARYHSLANNVQLCYDTPFIGHYASHCPTMRNM